MNSKNFFTSNLEFKEFETDLKNKFQMINISIVLSSIGLIVGIISNTMHNIEGVIPVEIALLIMNIYLIISLRKGKEAFRYVALIETLQFTFFFLFLIYSSEPSQLKHIWILTYPMILLYLQNEKNAIYWVVFMILMLIIAPLQPFIEISYSLFQVIYISIVLAIISIIIFFYQKKMMEAKEMIIQKDKLLTIQSKQAVMGEMISMIAHQWRQPLSSVTLSISNIQIKRMLGEDIDKEVLDKTMDTISDTVVYLSETIDDFQTYFRPNKEIEKATLSDMIDKSIGFIKPRLKTKDIDINISIKLDELIDVYKNEFIQVLLNILNNSIDILIEKDIPNANINIVVDSNKYQAFVLVEDNAGGIATENLDHIFEPYFSTKGKNGTGLGLYMSQMIMQKQFGTNIEVSNTNNGALFKIVIPKKLS
jgi:signal transduction histidine kinase